MTEKEILAIIKIDDEDLGEFITRINANELSNASLLKLIGIMESMKLDILEELKER